MAKSLASKEGWDYYTEPTPEDYGKIAYNPMSTNNATNFSAKPVGYISVENNPKRDLIGLDIFEVGESAYFWTSSTNIDDEIAYIRLYCSEPTISVHWDIKAEHPDFYGSFHDIFNSVRCVKNEREEQYDTEKKTSKLKNNKVVDFITSAAEEIRF